MKVRLISYTQPDNIIGVDDAQELDCILCQSVQSGQSKQQGNQ